MRSSESKTINHRPDCRLFIALALLLLLVTACGYKGPVRPKLLPVPAAVTDLQLQQRGNDLLLSWKIPSSNADGTPLTDLQEFRIYRMTFDPASDCPDCRDTSTLLATIALSYPTPALRYADRLFYTARDILPNQGYLYRVTPVNADRQAGNPATVRTVLVTPPLVPTGLTAAGLDRQIRLQWQAAPGVSGYALFRTRPGQPFPPWPVHSGVLTKTEFNDFAVENGTDYLYAVRSVNEATGGKVESSLSPTVQVRPGPLH